MATRSSNTQAEALGGVLHSLQDITLMPDADMPFLTSVMGLITQYLRAPLEQMVQQNGAAGMQGGQPPMPGGGQGPPAMGMGGGQGGMGPGQPMQLPPPMPGNGMGPGGPMGGGGGMPGPPQGMGNLRPDIQGPPTDEIRRMLAGGR